MDRISRAIHEKIDESSALSVVTPIYQASAFESGSPFFYTRKDNPNTREFENVVAILEEARYAISTTTGMSAIHLVLSLLPINSTIVVNAHIYGCSYKLFHDFCDRLNIKLVILDLSREENIERIPADAFMVFFETPTNPFLKTVNIEKVSVKAKGQNAETLIVVDNTWATPLFQKPLEHGADVSLHSATKYFSGHSDVMGGCILIDNERLYERLKELRFYQGSILAPYSGWLLRRSLQTLEIRLKRQSDTTRKVMEFLKVHPLAETVFYPDIDGYQLIDYATLIFFTFPETHIEFYQKFTKNLRLFSTGTGMACVSSMIAQPYTGSHASMNDEEKASMGLDTSLIRLSFGLEPAEDLIRDLSNAFESIRTDNQPTE